MKSNLSYLGVDAPTPPNLVFIDRAPTVNDYKEYVIGTIWVVKGTSQLYMLTLKSAGVATWIQIQTAGGGDNVESLIASDGNHAVPDVAGDVIIAGGTNINTTSLVANTLTVNLNDSVNLAGDLDVTGKITAGTGLTITTGGLDTSGDVEFDAGVQFSALGVGTLRTDGTGVVSVLADGNDGEILIGATGAIPVWNTLTAGTNIVIDNTTPNNITISAPGSGGGAAIGSIMEFEGTLLPGSNWLECDGSAVSQTTYADLFASIGHKYCYPTFSLVTAPFSATAVAHNKLAAPDDLWCIVAGTNAAISDDDGASWTTSVLPISARAVAHNGLSGVDGLWVAVGGTHLSAIATSPDGLAWTLRVDTNLNYGGDSIVHNGKAAPDGLWIVSSSQYTNSSSDGITWNTASELTIYLTYNEARDEWIGTNAATRIPYIYASSDGGVTSDLVYAFQDGYYYSPHGIYHTDTIYGISILPNDKYIFVTRGKYTGGLQSYISADTLTWTTAGAIVGNDGWYIYNYGCQVNCIGRDSGSVLVGTIAATHGDLKNKLFRSIDGKNWAELDSPFTATDINCIASNMESDEDTLWMVASGTQLALGEPDIDTSLEFYLPNKPGYIILS